MIVPDANLLIYAYDPASPFHDRARTWWESCLSGREAVGLTHVVTFGFLRITTQRRIFEHPLSLEEATEHVRSWLARTVARVLIADVDHFERVADLLQVAGNSAGNLVTGAQIGALAMAHNATVHTADHDFRRFAGLSVTFPLDEPASGRRPRA